MKSCREVHALLVRLALIDRPVLSPFVFTMLQLVVPEAKRLPLEEASLLSSLISGRMPRVRRSSGVVMPDVLIPRARQTPGEGSTS